jgi:hypothetical protein
MKSLKNYLSRLGKHLQKGPEHDTKTIYENEERGIFNVSVQKPK